MVITLALLAGLALTAHGQPAGEKPDKECCDTKTVGGVTYSLIGQMDTKMYNCLSDCIYMREGQEGGKFCFAMGDLQVECNDEEMEGSEKPPMEGSEKPPMEGSEKPPMGGSEMPPMEGSEMPPMEGSEMPPMEGSEMPPMEGSEMPPMEGSEKPPMEGSEKPPMEGSEKPPVGEGASAAPGSNAQKWLPWYLGMEPMELCVETGTEVIFNKTGHNVVQMATQSDYDGCTGFLGENPTVGNNIDPFPWQAQMDGVYYFACGVGTHCSAGGMKAKITVAPTCAKNVTVPWSFGMEPQVICVQTGTTVIIEKTGSFHNVNMLATQSDYDNCTGFTDTAGNSDNPYIFQAEIQGSYYFACGVGTHCKSGNMKAMITVADSC